MAKQPAAPPPSLFRMLCDKVAPFVPAPVKNRFNRLTAQQRQTLVFGGGGLVAFLLVWALFAALQPAPVLVRQPKKTIDPGTVTAITHPVPNFPDSVATTDNRKVDPLEALTLTAAQKDQLMKLRQNVNNEYRNALSFPLDETKMIAFAQAATKIDLINSRWDVLIAAAANDTLAREYLNSATLENRQLLAQSVDVTEAEYNEIYSLTTRDKRFNDVANAYKKLVTDGIWGPVTPTVLSKGGGTRIDPSTLFPVKPAPAVEISKPAAPAASGTGPAPAGSPAPPYSPPSSR